MSESAMSNPASSTMKQPRTSWWRDVPWWAVAVIATGFLVLYLILSSPNYHDTFIYLRQGVITTLRITLFAYLIAVTLGLILGLGRTAKNVLIYNLATLYVTVVRGIPMVVILLYMAFGLIPLLVHALNGLGEWGLATFGGLSVFQTLADLTTRKLSMEWRAIIALGLGYAAYEAEVFRAGIQSIGRGQMEAALSLGMSTFQAMRFVILPQAIRRVLPPLGNDFVALLKDSSLATVLAVREITQLSRLRKASTFRVIETYNVVAFLYLSMTLLLTAFVRYLERKMKVVE